jgi:hypothetical protein
MVLEKIKSGLNAVASTLDSKLDESLSFLSDIKEAGSEKIDAMVNKIQTLAPLIDQTGFNMNELEVGIGIPPEINLAFEKIKDVDAETIEKLLKANEDKPLLSLIIHTLQKADALVKGMNLTNFRLGQLSMKIGLPPDVSIKLLRMENAIEL